jgi:AcrR family transcriptional regulator
MATEYSGSGDPARSLALLWGVQPQRSRGPRPGLDVARVVRAAVELADEEGLAALSMRRVAERLGVGTMSLYTYVPGKPELLDLMLDTVLGERALPEVGDADWRAALEALAREDWAHYHRHPWVLEISGTRALLGPHELDGFEAAVRVVCGLGLTGREMVAVVTVVGQYVRGAAEAATDAAQAERRTGVSEDAWWNAREPILDQVFDPARYPTLVAIEAEGAFAAERGAPDYTLSRAVADFEFGLARLLDGIATLVRARGTAGPRGQG